MILEAAAESSLPWWDTSIFGVIVGTVLTGLLAYALGMQNARVQRREAALQRDFDRVEARREGRADAASRLIAAALKSADAAVRFEVEHGGASLGDLFPEEMSENDVDLAFAEFSIQVPDASGAVGSALRDQVYLLSWGWNPTARVAGTATHTDVQDAVTVLREHMRTLLGNDV
ncbi:hypothetical protein RDI86_08780 [Cellulosimicrobium sp. XJ-DQ-B-000]|uniref:hypothetical protein n=1 Tax=Cellulosimicrobium sp. XJ-DQ-B-000 TaxID=3072182 RepID=UPI0028085FD2|nr:hypothetical protein [Cellulosimicrobium sp. XJ-DQ-B-000]MDQ8041950.1 hypothetical protein [Cellulosimicrobium sp. XJ-DQ-B-000]